MLVDPAVTRFVVGAGTGASSTLGIPLDPALQGLLIYTQAFSLDVPANSAGLTVSNGGRLRIGA